MLKQLHQPIAAYDHIGAYDQDGINGFKDDLLDRFLQIVEPQRAETILDAMAGDGNLTGRLYHYCHLRSIKLPRTVVLEYSQVQAKLAAQRLDGLPATIFWGDALTMKSFENDDELEPESFDRVMIKSANHEIPLSAQYDLYEAVYRVLKPGGTFVNLGFLFDDEEERDEFREIARTKDRLAKMEHAVHNRHFLLRAELHQLLRQSGFSSVKGAINFDYSIESQKVTEHYFKSPEEDMEHQVAQCRARKLRRSGRIRFLRDRTIMRCPGEITVARKPSAEVLNLRTFHEYPYDFLRNIKAHREMLDRVVDYIPAQSRVLDIACGIGLLAERLQESEIKYSGLDVSSEYIGIARDRYGHVPGFWFNRLDIQRAEVPEDSFDVVTILNALYLPGFDALVALRKAYDALVPGGRLILSGPLSRASFTNAEPHIRAQLQRDGILPDAAETYDAIIQANQRLLTQHGNYWSAEGLLELLKSVGFSRVLELSTELYYQCSYLAVVEKPSA